MGTRYQLGILFLLISSAHAGDSLSYSGRLVNANGSPVLGPVNLKFDLASTADTNVILCSQQISNVSLANGVFHVKLDLSCGASSLSQVLTSIPSTESPVVRVTNQSVGKVYSFQALYSVPSAQIAHGLSKLNANNNEVLTWTGSKWEPKPVAGATGGTVTEVIAGSGLSGGTITNSGTIAIASGGVTNTHLAGSIARTKLLSGTANYVLVNNASGVMSEVAELPLTQGGTGANTAANARTNLGLGTAATATIGYAAGNVLPADNIPVCLPAFKLQFTGVGPTYWSCANDNDSLDGTKLPLAGGTMAGSIDMGVNKILNLAAPTTGTDAATKSYVDTINNGVTTSLSGKEPTITAGTVVQYWRGDKSWQALNGNAVANTSAGNIAATNVQAALNELDSEKQPLIAAGTTAQYWRGDKSWQTLNTAAVPESGNLYYSDARVRAAPLSGYAMGSATALAASDTMLAAFGKLEAQISANLTAFNNTGKWSKNGASIYFNTGSVGIGNTAPAQALHVNGNIRVDNGTSAAIYNSGGMYFSGLDGAGTHTNYIFRPGWGSAGNTLATIYLQNANTSGGYNNCVMLASYGASYINCGALGIGTATPQAHLDVVGNIRSTAPSGTAAKLDLYVPAAAANQRLTELYQDTNALVLRYVNDAYSSASTVFHSYRIAGSHNISHTIFDGNIGLSLTPSYKFHANGVVAGVGAYVNASDRKLKKNIKPISDAEKILTLQGVYFDWRQDEFPKMNFEQTHDVGVIAQEVEKVFPEAVKTDKQGYKSVAYSKLIAPLIEVTKNDHKKIKSLEEKVSALSSVNEQLRKENALIKDYICSKDPKAPLCK